MAQSLLNPWALDIDGKFISVEHARKGQEYFCPKCRQPFSFCQKGEGIHSRQNHFKHKVHTNCSGPSESEIHKFAKEGIFEILRSLIEKRQDFPMLWTCPECGMDFKANLLKRVVSVEMEKDLGTSRPDIALLDENGIVIVAVEIVFTHEPTANTMRFYDDNNIVLVRIVVHSAEECNDLVQKLKYPDSVNLCFNEHCNRSQTMQVFRKIVPVVNSQKQIIGLAVAMDNPTEDEPVYGLPFTKQDQRKAVELAQQYWPNVSLTYVNGPDFTYLAPKTQQNLNLQTQLRQRPIVHHPDIDTLIRKQQQVKAIRRSYAISGKKTKKSGGKRRR